MKSQKKQIMTKFQHISEITIKLVLNKLIKEGFIKLVSKARNSGYIKIGK